MTRDRIIQLVSLGVLIVAVSVCGTILPRVIDMSDRYALRYTDVSVDGAPPFVAVGQAIGALRGLIVDYLWIKVHIRREQGLFYEVMHDAELITRLQPRFAGVWAFHGHNMAYNISVATHTEQERWEWVNAGIRLVRNRGLRYNPNDLQLHRELAFWFAHKIEGVADDAHLYYKREFTREWHYVLGEPPTDYEDRIEWMKGIAEAPETIEEAIRKEPKVRVLVERLTDSLDQLTRADRFQPDRRFLRMYAEWEAVTQHSAVAEMLGYEEQFRRDYPIFAAIDELARDPEFERAWEVLLRHARKRVLLDEYNMDPNLMYQFTRDLGPIDWRHGQAHALYWSRRGSIYGEPRVLREDDIYKVINNDRVQLQAMQGLARNGRVSFDLFSADILPGRFPEWRWIDTIDKEAERAYVKHFRTRGGGGETFLGFLQNFMSSAVRELYRSGETARAQQILDRLDELFGSGQIDGPVGANPRYSFPLDVFIREEIRDEYTYQPHMAPSEVASALRRGLRFGIGQGQPEIYEQTLTFAHQVTEYFRTHDEIDFDTRFGTGRMRELLSQLDRSLEVAFEQLMRDPTVPLQERLSIWRQTAQHEPELRLRVYDRIRPEMQRHFAQHPLSQAYAFEELFPTPRGIEAYRQRMAEERRRQEEALEERRRRADIERQ